MILGFIWTDSGLLYIVVQVYLLIVTFSVDVEPLILGLFN